MLENLLRPTIQKALVDPCAALFKQTPIMGPNVITLLAALSGLLVLPALYWQHPILALAMLWLSGYFDMLDGSVARLKAQTSALGTVYDIMADRLVELVVILALFSVDPTTRGLAALAMLGSVLLCVTSFLVVGIFSEQVSADKSFDYSPGLIERAEAFIFFSAMILLPAYFHQLAALFSILVIWTACFRIYQFSYMSRCPEAEGS